MTMNTNVYLTQAFNNNGITLLNADNTTVKDLFTAGAKAIP